MKETVSSQKIACPSLDSLVKTKEMSPYELAVAKSLYAVYCDNLQDGWSLEDAEIDFFEQYFDQVEAFPSY